MAQRIQRRRTAGWRMPRNTVYVGRPSRWGNPFRIYNGHSTIGPMWHVARNSWRHLPASECVWGYVTSSDPLGPEAAVDLYRHLLKVRAMDEPDRLRDWVAPLVGQDLACWCPVAEPCHADVLLSIANPGVSAEAHDEIADLVHQERTNDARDRYEETTQ